MKPISLTQKAHTLIKDRLTSGAIGIDATVGNGHDTLFMAHCVGGTGQVFGFDIQQAALNTTRQRFQDSRLANCLTLFHARHALMTEMIPEHWHGKISAIMFNLGYLPGGDKSVTTQTNSTLIALSKAIQLLSPTGILTILAYPGHQGGNIETDRVNYWCSQLDQQQFTVDVFAATEYNSSSPVLFVIAKTG